MVILYYVLIFLATIIGSILLYLAFKKFNDKKSIIMKVLSLVLALVIFIRYMLGRAAIYETQGLNMYSPFKDDIFSTGLSIILGWFTYAGILFLVLYPFFKVNNIRNVLKFLAVPTLLLDAIFFKTYAISIAGLEAFNGFDLRVMLLSIEIII